MSRRYRCNIVDWQLNECDAVALRLHAEAQANHHFNWQRLRTDTKSYIAHTHTHNDWLAVLRMDPKRSSISSSSTISQPLISTRCCSSMWIIVNIKQWFARGSENSNKSSCYRGWATRIVYNCKNCNILYWKLEGNFMYIYGVGARVRSVSYSKYGRCDNDNYYANAGAINSFCVYLTILTICE